MVKLEAPLPLPEGFAVYPDVLPSSICQTVIAHFEQHHGAPDPRVVNRGKLPYKSLILKEDEMRTDRGDLGQAHRLIAQAVVHYWTEHVAGGDYRDQLIAGFHSLEPRVKRYDPGDRFPLHTDDFTLFAYKRRFAYIVYLSDDFEGGDTVFYSASKEIGRVQAVKGSMLMFPVNPVFMHEGEEVRSGSKYVLNGFPLSLVTVMKYGKTLRSALSEIEETARDLAGDAMRLHGYGE